MNDCKPNSLRLAACLVVVLAISACEGGDPNAAAPGKGSHGPGTSTTQVVATPPDIASAVAGEWRDPAHVARDRFRNPAQLLEFLDVDSASRVVVLGDDPLYYAAILGPFLREKGSLTVAASDAQGLSLGLQRQPRVFAGVSVTDLTESMGLRLEQQADMILLSGLVDDAVRAGEGETLFRTLHDQLADGGILGVVQNRAVGSGPRDGRDGYLSEPQVVFLAELAGFQLVKWSEMSSNPRDTRDGALDPDAGEPDRMTLKFRKAAP